MSPCCFLGWQWPVGAMPKVIIEVAGTFVHCNTNQLKSVMTELGLPVGGSSTSQGDASILDCADDAAQQLLDLLSRQFPLQGAATRVLGTALRTAQVRGSRLSSMTVRDVPLLKIVGWISSAADAKRHLSRIMIAEAVQCVVQCDGIEGLHPAPPPPPLGHVGLYPGNAHSASVISSSADECERVSSLNSALIDVACGTDTPWQAAVESFRLDGDDDCCDLCVGADEVPFGDVATADAGGGPTCRQSLVAGDSIVGLACEQQRDQQVAPTAIASVREDPATSVSHHCPVAFGRGKGRGAPFGSARIAQRQGASGSARIAQGQGVGIANDTVQEIVVPVPSGIPCEIVVSDNIGMRRAKCSCPPDDDNGRDVPSIKRKGTYHSKAFAHSNANGHDANGWECVPISPSDVSLLHESRVSDANGHVDDDNGCGVGHSEVVQLLCVAVDPPMKRNGTIHSMTLAPSNENGHVANGRDSITTVVSDNNGMRRAESSCLPDDVNGRDVPQIKCKGTNHSKTFAPSNANDHDANGLVCHDANANGHVYDPPMKRNGTFHSKTFAPSNAMTTEHSMTFERQAARVIADRYGESFFATHSKTFAPSNANCHDAIGRVCHDAEVQEFLREGRRYFRDRGWPLHTVSME